MQCIQRCSIKAPRQTAEREHAGHTAIKRQYSDTTRRSSHYCLQHVTPTA